jgi:C4-dicarboxylate-specific signal transduction histidine kinase
MSVSQSARPVLTGELRALLDALPVPLALLGSGDEVLFANAALRGRPGALDPGKLAGADSIDTPFGRCVVVLSEAMTGSQAQANPQMQRLASLGFMLAGVCHEVSNPLAAIHSMVQILQSPRGVSSETLDKGLASIGANIARVLAITRKLGDFSRVTGDAAVTQRIDAAVHEAAALLRHNRWGGVGVRVDYRGLDEAVTRARPGELQQVLFNVLLNAAQAMDGVGRIDVHADHAADGSIRVSVRDSGPGIPVEHLERVFDPFFTTKPPGEGTGLGLAISYEIVHELGGAMRAANHPLGGACIEIELPGSA